MPYRKYPPCLEIYYLQRNVYFLLYSRGECCILLYYIHFFILYYMFDKFIIIIKVYINNRIEKKILNISLKIFFLFCYLFVLKICKYVLSV